MLKKKLCYLVPIVVLVIIMGTTSARGAVMHWTGGSVPNDPNWHNPANWDLGIVPQAGDDAYCKKVSPTKKDPNFTAQSSPDPLCLLCIVDTQSGVSSDGHLNIDGGTLNVISAVRTSKGSSGSNNATVKMKGGTLALYGADVMQGTCVGNSIQDGNFSWGPNAAGESTFGTWDMEGGLITCGTFSMPGAGTTSSSVFNLKGGTVIVRKPSSGLGGLSDGFQGFFLNETFNTTCTEPNQFLRKGKPSSGGGSGKLNISGGKMIIQGNVTPLFENRYCETTSTAMGLIDPCGVIVAYPELSATSYNKYIVYDYDQRNDGKTTLTAAASLKAKAWKPSPVDGALYVSEAPTLRWSKGTNATSHDVYFGTSTSTWSSTNVLDSSDPNYVPTSPLALGKTYYWKVDEKATGGGTTPGDIWTFMTHGRAKGPNPGDGTSITPDATRTVTLSWTADTYATSHDVYFGTNSASLSLIADDITSPSKTYQPTLGATNYWRVDENIDSAYGGGTITGNIWSFTVTNYDLVDSFENYQSAVKTSGTAFGQWWFNSGGTMTLAVNSGTGYRDPVRTGKHGLQYQYSFGGAGSSYVYTKFPANQNWTTSGDKNCGAVTLSFWMRGKGNNGSLSNLYVMLATGTTSGTVYNSAKVQVPNFSSIIKNESGTNPTNADWINVNIPLSDFNGAGKGASFNLASVGRLFIVCESSGASDGYLWVDDIRLYVQRCVPDRVPASDLPTRAGAPLSDITDDCVVNYNDLLEIAGKTDRVWLDSNSVVSTNAVLYNTSSPWVSGKFGNAVKLGQPLDWVDIDDLAFPLFYDRTIAFWVRVDDIPGTIAGTRQYLFSTSRDWRLNIGAERTGTNTMDLLAVVGNEFVEPDAIGRTSVAEDEWHHVALVVGPKDTAGKVNVKFYVDGTFKEERTSLEAHYYNQLTGICLGALNNGNSQHSNATFDDFRIYGTALSGSDIALLADSNISTNPSATPLIKYDFNESSGTTAANTGSLTSVNHPVGYTLSPLVKVSPAELYTGIDAGKTYINFKDYAKFANNWLYSWVYP